MKHPLTKAALSLARQNLVQMMQNLNFGRIEGLTIRNGEPVLAPAPRIIEEIKLGGENGPRAETGARDFVLKARVVELFQQFDRVGNGLVEVLEIKHGLPIRLDVAKTKA